MTIGAADISNVFVGLKYFLHTPKRTLTRVNHHCRMHVRETDLAHPRHVLDIEVLVPTKCQHRSLYKFKCTPRNKWYL